MIAPQPQPLPALPTSTSASMYPHTSPRSTHQPHPPNGPTPSQQFHGYNNPIISPNFFDAYPYSGSSSHFSSSLTSADKTKSYLQPPKAQTLPQAHPTGSGSGGSTGDIVPVDVVDKVAAMGFSRDQVRADMMKLTENGQPVDLSVVLDKLMNDREIQTHKGWFGW